MKTRYEINATITTKHGSTITSCWNSYKKTHPLQKFFAEKVGKPHNIYLHAEVRALIIASIQTYGTPYTLTVQRVDRNDKLTDAKPCEICVEAALFFGIKKINYTTKNGWVYGKTPQELKDEYSKSK